MNTQTDIDAVLAKAREEAVNSEMLKTYLRVNDEFDAIQKADPLRKAQLVNAMVAREHRGELAMLNKALDAESNAIQKADPLRKAQVVDAMAARQEHKAELARLNKALDEAVARRAPAAEVALLEARRNRVDRA